MRGLLIVLMASLLAACGFQLRGSYSLPWETLYIGLPENNEIYIQLKRSIETSTQTRIVADAKQAQASLIVLHNEHGKNILSLSAKARVREIQLTRSFVYRIQDAAGKELVPNGSIIIQRDMSFNETLTLAKEAEETTILREMQSDLVQQLLRRLAAAKAQPAS